MALVIKDDAGEMVRYITWWAPQRERVVINRVLQALPLIVTTLGLGVRLVLALVVGLGPIGVATIGATPLSVAMIGPSGSTPPPSPVGGE